MPRLAVASIVVVAMHVVLLTMRPGALASSYVARSAPVMAVRMVASERAVADPVARHDEPAAPASQMRTPVVARAPEQPVSERAAAVPASRPRSTAAEPEVAASARRTDDRARPTAAAPQPDSADTPLAAAPDYAFGTRLDPGPRPLDEIEPDYPDTVRLREGTVVLRLLISDTGHVDDVGVVRSEPRGVFEEAAIEAFSKARFAPGLAAGTPVKSQITVEVQFMPINRGARVSGRSY